jgi:hypothetical protein
MVTARFGDIGLRHSVRRFPAIGIHRKGIVVKRLNALSFVLLLFAAAATAGAAEPAAFKLTALNAMERIGQQEPAFGAAEVLIEAARNEVESFQVVVAARGGNVHVTKAQLSDLRGVDGALIGKQCAQLYREEYVRVRMSTPGAELPPGLYADALVPFIDPLSGKPIEPLSDHRAAWGEPSVRSGHDMYALPFDVFRGQNQPLWIDVQVPKDARPGVYRGSIRVTSHEGSAEIAVTLRVWGFTLPDGPTHRNHFGGFSGLTKFFNAKRDSDEFRQIEERYCRAMAEHRLNPPIPAHLLPDVKPDGSLAIDPQRHAALRKFIEELHVTDFQVPNAPFARLPHAASKPGYKEIPPAEREKAQRYYRQYYDYLKQNGWNQRAYLYMLDEPNTRENYEQVLVLGQVVHEAVPELRRLVVEQTFLQDPAWPDIDPAVDIWCPLFSYIDRDSILARFAEGDEVWSYTALVQRAPSYHPHYTEVKGQDPPHWHIDWPLLVYRVPTWINRQYQITGLLYWSAVTAVMEPWCNPAFAHPRHYNGGGYLLYPGTPCGFDGPVASMRLKNIRDGMEDYEYFALLEKAGGGKAVQKAIDRVAPTWWQYCRDPQTLLEARRALAEQIEKTLQGK